MADVLGPPPPGHVDDELIANIIIYGKYPRIHNLSRLELTTSIFCLSRWSYHCKIPVPCRWWPWLDGQFWPFSAFNRGWSTRWVWSGSLWVNLCAWHFLQKCEIKFLAGVYRAIKEAMSQNGFTQHEQYSGYITENKEFLFALLGVIKCIAQVMPSGLMQSVMTRCALSLIPKGLILTEYVQLGGVLSPHAYSRVPGGLAQAFGLLQVGNIDQVPDWVQIQHAQRGLPQLPAWVAAVNNIQYHEFLRPSWMADLAIPWTYDSYLWILLLVPLRIYT